MVARKLSSFDVGMSSDLCKRPSVYIDPDSDIFEGLQYLQNIDKDNCVNCMQLWKSSKMTEGNKSLDIKFTFYEPKR
jgi:hypothetical protein